MLQDGSPYFEETVMVEEDPDAPASVVSVQTGEDGTTRRTETKVKKVIKTVTTRTVHGLPPDPLPPDLPLPRGAYTQTLDRLPRPNGDGGYSTAGGSATLPRGYSYQDAYAPRPPEAYGSLSRGVRVDQRYNPALDGYRGPGYGAQPQVLGRSQPERFLSEPYGLEDDRRSLGYDDGDYGPGLEYGTAKRAATPSDLRTLYLRSRSFEDPLSDEGRSEPDPYFWAPLAQAERAGSLASLASSRRAPPVHWRKPELPEVLAMLSYKLDAVKANAAAYLQHLCFRNDKVKSEVRRLKGIPVLVELLEHPGKEVHLGACGALKNISYGRDADNKKAIRNCEGVPALVRLLRKARDMDLNEVITGTLWNLSSHDAVKMDIVEHAVPALCDEVIIPHSGWERAHCEDAKPRHVEWEGVLTNTAGCLRNVSSEKREARQKLRECSGLVDSLMHILQSEIEQKDVNSKLVENCVCLLRNLSFQVHREIPEAGALQEAPGTGPNPGGGPGKPSCFGGRKGRGRRNAESVSAEVDLPKRTSPAKGYELLYQPEVVRLYLSLMRESSNPAVLEAVAGALQNLCAGRWMYGRYIRAAVRQEKGLSHVAEHLTHGSDRVVKAVSGALRNLSLDARNKELIGKHALPDLIHNLPPVAQGDPGRHLAEDTVVSVLQTINELLVDNVETGRRFREQQGVERLVAINRTGTRSDREVKASTAVLQTLWGHRELRKPLERDGWKKADFQPLVTPRGPTGSAFDDSTLPLIAKSQGGGDKREMIPLDSLGPDSYSTIDRREPDRLRDTTSDPTEREPLND